MNQNSAPRRAALRLPASGACCAGALGSPSRWRAASRPLRRAPRRRRQSRRRPAHPRRRATSGSSTAPCSSYLPIQPGDTVDAGAIDLALKTLFRTDLFADVQIELQGGDLVVTRGREPDHQPGGLRGEQGAQGRQAARRGHHPPARHLHPRQGAGRRPADRRALSPLGPDLGHRDAQDRRAAAEARRPDLRDRRRPEERHPAGQLPRQQGLLRQRPARRGRDRGEPLVQVLLDPTTTTTPTGSSTTRSSCASSIATAATTTSASSRRSPNWRPDKNGFAVTYTLDEGPKYRFGKLRSRPSCRSWTATSCSQLLPIQDRRDLPGPTRSRRPPTP